MDKNTKSLVWRQEAEDEDKAKGRTQDQVTLEAWKDIANGIERMLKFISCLIYSLLTSGMKIQEIPPV